VVVADGLMWYSDEYLDVLMAPEFCRVVDLA
jgi:hypothetical protein